MPTLTAIALDRFLEPGASKPVEKSVPSGKPPYSKPPVSKLERRSTKPAKKRTGTRPQMSPALYATPDAIPIPDSPSSFPPSPYIINHKARGPRLLKSFSEDLSSCEKTNGDADIKGSNLRKSTSVTFTIPEPIVEDHADGAGECPTEKFNLNGSNDGPVLVGIRKGEIGSREVELGTSSSGVGSNDVRNGLERVEDLPNLVAANVDRDGEPEDFYDPGESASFASSTELEDDAGANSSQKQAAQMGEFYDAWEELSSESGMQTSARNLEAELSEIRLSLLMEIEKRKQAEEDLNHLRTHWQRIRQQLTEVGLTLPSDLAVVANSEEPNINLSEELCHRFDVARFVSDSIGRGIANAEAEMEMEVKIEAKNFEIARLSDRLHYYEAVNREMSQRNQEAIEVARRDRQRRKRRQRWVWGSIAATIALGSAALAWSYLPSGKSGSSQDSLHVPESDE